MGTLHHPCPCDSLDSWHHRPRWCAQRHDLERPNAMVVHLAIGPLARLLGFHRRVHDGARGV